MGWILLILVLLAAAFGILGAVVKAVAFLVLTIVLTVVTLSILVWWLVRRQARRFVAEFDARIGTSAAPHRPSRDRGSELPRAHDDRY
jgi:peptidoglycan/LPS O-acetylase OafA/YrhL